MNEGWRLARRDLRGGLGGLGLLWLCLAIAVAAIASVTSVASAIDHAIASNGRELIGGDLVVRSAQRAASAEELAALQAAGRVSQSVTLRSMVSGGFKGDSALAELSSIDAEWPLAGGLQLARGGGRPHGRAAVIGRELAERIGVARGDRVRIGFADFAVTGIIDKMPSMSGFALAPPVLVDEAGLRASGLMQPGSLASYSYRVVLPPARDPEVVGKAFQRRFADGGWSVTDRNDAGQGTRRFVDRVAEMLLLVALAALAIGGLGIASAAAAFAASRRGTVATLKLLGAGRLSLGAMLGIEVALIAAAAIAVGLMVGAVAPAAVAAIAAKSLPIVPDAAPQWRALVEAAAFGVLVTIAAAWGPLAGAVDTRPASLLRGDVGEGPQRRRWLVPVIALAGAAGLAVGTAQDPRFAAFGVGAIGGLALLFAGVGWAIRLAARRPRHHGGPIMRLGVSALDRPGAATVRLSVALGLGLALLVTLAATAQSLLATIDEQVPGRAPALFLIDIPANERARFEDLAKRAAPGAQLRLVPSLRGPVTAVNGVPVAEMKNVPEGAWILRGDRGLTFAEALPPGNRVTAGEWWPANYRGQPLISIDQNAATALGLKVGDKMTIGVLGRPIEARIASLREIDWRSMGFNFAIIFSPGGLEEAPYSLMATVAPVPGRGTAGIEHALASDLPMVSVIRVGDIVAQVRALLVALAAAVRIATAVASLLGVIVLAGAVVATRQSRARDMVLLKLVGATRSDVLASQAIEFALLALAVTVSALASGLGSAWLLLSKSFELDFQPGWWALIGLAVGAIAVTIGAALLAALPVLNARPAAALRAL